MVKRFDFKAIRGGELRVVDCDDGNFVSHEDYAALLAKLEIAKKALNEIQVNGDDESHAIAWKAIDDIREPVDVPTGTQDHGFPLHD